MASVSVVHFNTTSPHKVLQQQNNPSNNNTSNSNNSDRRDIIVLRKTPQILPQPKDFTKGGDILITNTGRKKSRSSKDIRTQPQPIAVARRNARERNRVKQVNNGFANLRQHIPNFIAATFESNARGGNKKLSKVETLRMAVEYIRSLEDLLAMDHDNNSETNLSNSSTYSSPPPPPLQSSSLPSSTTTTTSTNNLQYHQIMSPPTDDDDLSSNPTSSPQYIRIDTTTYQIIPSHLYDDSENLEPLNILSEADLEFSNSQDLLQSIHSDSLSPGIYSEQSLSPGIIEKDTSIQRYPQIYQDDGSLVQIKTEIGADIPVMSLKTEQELPQQCKNNVINVMQWWEQQQQQQQQQHQEQQEHPDNIS